MYTLKHLLDLGERITKVFENKYCYIFYTIGKTNKVTRWAMKKDTYEVGSCGVFVQLLDYTNGTPEDLVEVDTKVLEAYIDKPIRPKKIASSLRDYEDDYI